MAPIENAHLHQALGKIQGELENLPALIEQVVRPLLDKQNEEVIAILSKALEECSEQHCGRIDRNKVAITALEKIVAHGRKYVFILLATVAGAAAFGSNADDLVSVIMGLVK